MQPNSPYPYRGTVLATLLTMFLGAVILYIPALVASTGGTATVSGLLSFFLVIGTLLGAGALVAIFALDWRGVLLLRGRVPWATLSSAAKFWYVVAWVCFYPFLFLAYLVYALQDYYISTQQRPADQAKQVWGRIKGASRGIQIALGIAVLLTSCVYCSSLGQAFGAASQATQKATQNDQPAPVVYISDSPQTTDTPTPQPSPTAEAKPTLTPSPTPTPAPPTPAPAPTWKTVKTFSGNGISKTAPFTVNADQWKIVWSCNPAAYGSEYNLIADLTVPGDQFGDSVVNVICKQGDPSSVAGETMEYGGGTYYLDVNSEATWTFKIEAYQ